MLRFLCTQLWQLLVGLLNRKDLPYITLSVDTKFEMTDGYVTVLVARFVEFNECPVFPLATVIHERKLGETHRFFWQKVTQHFPQHQSPHLIFILCRTKKMQLLVVLRNLCLTLTPTVAGIILKQKQNSKTNSMSLTRWDHFQGKII